MPGDRVEEELEGVACRAGLVVERHGRLRGLGGRGRVRLGLVLLHGDAPRLKRGAQLTRVLLVEIMLDSKRLEFLLADAAAFLRGVEESFECYLVDGGDQRFAPFVYAWARLCRRRKRSTRPLWPITRGRPV